LRRSPRRRVLGVPGHGRSGRPQVLRRRHHGWARQFSWGHRGRAAPGRIGEPRRRLYLLRVQGCHRLRPHHPAVALAATGSLRQEGVTSMRRTWVVVIGAVVLVLPFLRVDDYYLHLLIMAGLFYLLAAGMNLLLAAGQLNLGHTAFFGIGAYASGLLALHFGLSPLLTMPLAAAFTALVGVAVGRLTLKLRGAYFVLVTTGFAEVIRLVATN